MAVKKTKADAPAAGEQTLKLHTLKPNPGARKASVRVGRGEGSGHGKSSGKGGKGQTQRSGGGVSPGFEGGQMPLYRRLSKYGFRSQSKVLGVNRFNVINLGLLEKHFKAGDVVDAAALMARGFGRTNRNQAGFKVLGTGTLSKALTVKVAACSETAKAAIEKAGGKLELTVLPPKSEVASAGKKPATKQSAKA